MCGLIAHVIILSAALVQAIVVKIKKMTALKRRNVDYPALQIVQGDAQMT
jgi:hypothetical protein